MKGKIWIRLGLALGTVFCLFSLSWAFFVIVVNAIAFNSTLTLRDFYLFGWALSCLIGPILAWIAHGLKSRYWPWIFIGIPSAVSIYFDFFYP